MRYARTSDSITKSDEPNTVIKASVFGGEPPTPTALANPDDEQELYQIGDVLVPPYEPASLCRMVERSASLRPNIDAYTVNIEAFGHRLKARIDLEVDGADDKIRDALLLERIFDGKMPTIETSDVEARKLEIAAGMRIERLQLENFFENCVDSMSFVELRKRTRYDLETTGNAYWEILRDRSGAIAQLVFVPSVTMRIMRSDVQFTECSIARRITSISLRRERTKRRFRRYVQYMRGMPVVWFKELDDPRTVSSTSGKYYDTVEAMRRSEPKATPANEILHFRIYSPTSVYGVPRWIGATLAVVGSRAAEEVNATYFDNKAVPPLAILVSGGRLADGAADRIKNFIREHLQGRENFHSVMVLEADSASAGAMTGGAQSRVRIDVKPLMEAQQNDALFQTYDANNTEKVGQQFRLPRLLRGNMSDFNRATAEGALQYAEQQVFQPERNEIDYLIDRRILASKGVRFHEFVSNAPDMRDPPVVAKILADLVEACIITPHEARAFASEVFNEDLPGNVEPWTRIPPRLMLQGIQPAPTDAEIEAAAAMADGEGAEAGKPSVSLAPTDAALVMRVNEARAAIGLGPLEGPDGNMTMAEYRAKTGATAGPTIAEAPPGAEQGKTLQALAGVRKALEAARVVASEGVKKQLEASRVLESQRVIKVPAEELAKWVVPEDGATDEARTEATPTSHA